MHYIRRTAANWAAIQGSFVPINHVGGTFAILDALIRGCRPMLACHPLCAAL